MKYDMQAICYENYSMFGGTGELSPSPRKILNLYIQPLIHSACMLEGASLVKQTKPTIRHSSSYFKDEYGTVIIMNKALMQSMLNSIPTLY